MSDDHKALIVGGALLLLAFTRRLPAPVRAQPERDIGGHDASDEKIHPATRAGADESSRRKEFSGGATPDAPSAAGRALVRR